MKAVFTVPSGETTRFGLGAVTLPVDGLPLTHAGIEIGRVQGVEVEKDGTALRFTAEIQEHILVVHGLSLIPVE